MTSQQTEPVLLPFCPFCGYSLEGLPTEHECPECGQPFDRRWRMHGGYARAKETWPNARMLTVVMWIAGCAYLAWTFSSLSIFEKLRPWPIRLALLAGVLLVVGLVAALWFRPRRFIAVGSLGVTLGRRGRGRREDLPWERIGRVRALPLGNSIILEVDGRGRDIFGVGMFVRASESQRCVADIGRRGRD
ncbi:MAG: hypothetical protein JXQ73_22795 [Phycisphaerae bacterium]|nr:hypothetical protein [Phycisphaerae bacterium]